MPRVIPNLPRLRIRSILLIVNAIVIFVPLSGIYFFKLYENELIRQTESELIAQSAYITALFKQEVGQKEYGTPLTIPIHKQGEIYTPILPQLDLYHTAILPPRPAAMPAILPTDHTALAISKTITPILHDAHLTTLVGISLMDYRGTVIMGKETGLSLSHLPEVQSALRGQAVSVIRERISDNPTPALASLSRGTHIRIFFATPIIHNDRLIGIALLSRSPRSILKALYEERTSAIAIGTLVIAAVLLMSFLTAYTINQPIRALLRQVRQAAEGQSSVPPINQPITQELAELSAQISLMAEKLYTRSEYIRQFAMHVSHEFKTPLTSIQGAIELLQEHEGDMSLVERQKFLNNSLQDTQRLKALVSRLLELARADALHPTQESCHILEVLYSIIGNYPHTHIHNETEYEHVAIPADIMATIMVNLLDNSKHNGATEIHIYLANTDDQLLLTIKDNGNGISPANAEKLFTPFFTTHREQGGTGLGLSIIQALLTAHHGSIELVEHSPHAVFRLHIPV